MIEVKSFESFQRMVAGNRNSGMRDTQRREPLSVPSPLFASRDPAHMPAMNTVTERRLNAAFR
jgi:hypothetical protein